MTKSYHANQPAIQLPLFVCTKICNKCKIEQSIEAFRKNKWTKSGYRSVCKRCDSDRAKKHRQENREMYSERSRNFYQNNKVHINEYRLKNIERRREYNKKRYNNDGEYRRRYAEYQSHWIASNRDRANSYNRKWLEAHPHKDTEYTMHYNARKKAALVDNVDYAVILERDGMYCYICEGWIRNPKEVAFDHVVPLRPREGNPQGTHSYENIRVTHKVCNSRKHNSPFEKMSRHKRRGPDYIVEERRKNI